MRIFWSTVLGALIGSGLIAAWHFFQPTEDNRNDLSVITGDRFSDFDDVSYFTDLRTKEFSLPNAGQADIDTLISALPKSITASYNDTTYDSGTGATRVTNLTLTPVDNEESGIQIDELILWKLDAQGLADRLAGKRLDETYQLSTRIEINGLNAFGLETLYQPIIDASNTLAVNALSDAINEPEFTVELSKARNSNIEAYEFSISKIIATNIDLHPYIINLISFDKNNDDARVTDDINLSLNAHTTEGNISNQQAIHWLQLLAAINRTIYIESAAMYDSIASIKMTDMNGFQSTMDISIPSYGFKGWDRGDMDLAILRDISFSAALGLTESEPANPDATAIEGLQSPSPLMTSFNLSGQVDFYKVSDFKLGTLLDHLARGIMPKSSTTDLMSLGFWQTANESWKVNEQKIYSVRKSIADLTNFHGFIPNKINIEIDDLTYNIGGLINLVSDLEAVEGQSTMTQEQRHTMLMAVSLLEKHDFAAPNMDWDLSWNWKPDTGAFVADHLFRIDDFLTFTADTNMGLQNYGSLVHNISDDMNEDDFAVLGQGFLEGFSLKSLNWRLADKGGMKKGFAMAVDFAELMPEDGSTPGFLRGANPKDLRLTTAAMLRFGAAPVSQELPQAKAYVAALADFIAKGGALEIKLDPQTPVTADMLTQLDSVENSPEELIKMLGFTFKHQPDNGITEKD